MIKGPLVTHAEKSSSDPRCKRSRAGRAADPRPRPAPLPNPRHRSFPCTMPGGVPKAGTVTYRGLACHAHLPVPRAPLPSVDRPQGRCPDGTPTADATSHAGHCPPPRSRLPDRPQNKVPLALQPLGLFSSCTRTPEPRCSHSWTGNAASCDRWVIHPGAMQTGRAEGSCRATRLLTLDLMLQHPPLPHG